MRSRILRLAQIFALAFLVVGVSPAIQAQTYTFKTLYSFKNNGKDPSFTGLYSFSAVPIVDAAGNLYGESFSGGDFNLGAVFKVTPSGALSVLHSFKGGTTDGAVSYTKLARDSAGNLYGTTSLGGTHNAGVVFKLTPSGKESIIYNFTNGSDGEAPNAVILDAAGNLYGTANGGSNGELAGTVFKIDTNNVFHLLYSFCALPSCIDGQAPNDPIVRDSAGNLYGSTQFGGGQDANLLGYGTVFKVSPGGTETVLWNFVDGGGGFPDGGVIQDQSGNLYGTSSSNQWGQLYKISEAGGNLSTLYSFCSLSDCSDGRIPMGQIQMDKSGNLYGITYESTVTSGSAGVVWKVDHAGVETVLSKFGTKVVTYGGVTIDSAGNLYGFTNNGGPAHRGSVYKLTPAK